MNALCAHLSPAVVTCFVIGRGCVAHHFLLVTLLPAYLHLLSLVAYDDCSVNSDDGD